MRRLEEILALSFPTRDLRSLSWSSESRLLAVGTRAGVIVAAVAEGGEMCRLGPYSPEGKLVEAGDVDWSRDGKFLAALGRDQTLRVWGRDGREVFALANDSFGSVEWSPDASQLVATDFGALIVREAGQARPLLTLAGDFSDFAWSPGGNLLAAADADFSLKAFSFPRRLPVQTLTGHENHVTSVAWSADGAWVASGSTDGTVRVWDPVQGTQLSRFEAGWTMAVDWSPAGPFLASGGIDGVVAVWDAERMERIAALAGLPGVVTAVEWSPDGRMLAAAAQDGTVHIWGARPP
jgi:WD40 repeat protein